MWGEDGPWKIFAGLRRLAGEGFWSGVLGCFYCLSLWVAAPIAWWLGGRWPERILLWLALSGGAILMQRLIVGTEATPPARWRVDPAPGREKGG